MQLRDTSIALVLIASFTFDAFAQMPGGGTRGRPGGDRQQGGQQRGEARPVPNDLANLLEYRLENMQDDLKLTPAQSRLFDAYAERVRALGEDITRERTRARTPSSPQLTAPKQIDQLLDIARNRMTALEDIAASAKALYDSLNTEQRLLADSRVATLVPLLAGSADNSGVPDPMRQRPPAGGYGRGPRDRDGGPPQ